MKVVCGSQQQDLEIEPMVGILRQLEGPLETTSCLFALERPPFQLQEVGASPAELEGDAIEYLRDLPLFLGSQCGAAESP